MRPTLKKIDCTTIPKHKFVSESNHIVDSGRSDIITATRAFAVNTNAIYSIIQRRPIIDISAGLLSITLKKLDQKFQINSNIINFQ